MASDADALPYSSYDQVPWYRKNWFAIQRMLLASALALLSVQAQAAGDPYPVLKECKDGDPNGSFTKISDAVMQAIESGDSKAIMATTEADAEAGDPSAMYGLGNEYHDGDNTPPSAELAIAWMSKAASLGVCNAAVRLARWYALPKFNKAVTIPVDMGKARAWLAVAANAGLPAALAMQKEKPFAGNQP